MACEWPRGGHRGPGYRGSERRREVRVKTGLVGDGETFRARPYVPPAGGRPRPPTTEEVLSQVLRFRHAAAFCAEYVPLAYAVEPLVRAGSLYTATAPTGSGKTAWFISLALAIATGR